ncbi:MAG TPA: hypothetical protein VKT80_11620, partial [Chloroflexota bacterium]|nr:hypothetical protein [Chloroflexota bacterium]
PLVHELVYYLAGTRGSDVNLVPGQPIRFKPNDESSSGVVALQPPDGEPKTLSTKSWPLVYEETREPGVYTLTDGNNRNSYFVVQSDPRESNLGLCKDEDRAKVSVLVPNLMYATSQEVTDTLTKGSATKELWLLAIVVVWLLLFGEVAMTRRMALARK